MDVFKRNSENTDHVFCMKGKDATQNGRNPTRNMQVHCKKSAQ